MAGVKNKVIKRHYPKVYALLVVAGLVLGLTGWYHPPVHAAGSQINAVICNPTASPTVTVTSPATDSVVNTVSVVVQGTTTQADTVTVSVNGSPVASIDVSVSQQFSTTVNLVQGTNTIHLDATYTCNGSHATADVIVTYEPTAAPSDGSTTPTHTPPTITPVSPAPQTGQSPPSTVSSGTTPDTVTTPSTTDDQPSSDGTSSAPLGTSVSDTSDQRSINWWLLLIILAGLMLLLAPSRLLNKIREDQAARVSIRMVGALLILIGVGLLTQNILEVMQYNGLNA